ncbi:toll-like receptor 18 [Heptranchias perlo]|uniref:toll-like receptor 18 n=1 Tax=Heptranchias perlo TaxID=212740 RepID=UPI00355949A1
MPPPLGRSWPTVAVAFLEFAVAAAQVRCRVQGTLVDCRGLHLLRVPADLPRDTEVLDLAYNKITSIGDSDFAQLAGLRELNLRYNNISWLDQGAFSSNLLLEVLDLFNNSLRSIPGAVLAPLQKLARLDISNNLYVGATLSDTFAGLGRLRDLSMGGDLVSSLRRDDLLPLRHAPLLDRFALKAGSSLAEYEAGALGALRCRSVWTDISVDRRPWILPAMLADLFRTPVRSVRFRKLFEFAYYAGSQDLFAGLRGSGLRNLTFFRGKFNENLLRYILQNLEGSGVRNLTLEAIDFARSINGSEGLPSIANLSLDYFTLKEISNPEVLRFNQRFTWFNKVHSLVINLVNFNYIPCEAWHEMKVVRLIDISHNQLKENYIYNRRCQYQGTLRYLEEFALNSNQIGSLQDVALLTARWPRLRAIDLSHNRIGSCQGPCPWGPPIARLVLHHNAVTGAIFRCLPLTLRYLDLSHSQLERLESAYFARATNLTRLLLSGNRIKFIPPDWRGASLRSLALDGNSFGVIGAGSLRHMPRLSSLSAGDNPYHCTCELYHFVRQIRETGALRLEGWPADYICYHPEGFIDTRLVDFTPQRLECDVGLLVAVSVSSTALVVVVSMLLCWRYDTPWYLRATWQIVRAKYRAKGPEPARTYTYHAFVSYSHSDAEWVREELVRRLEGARPPYRVCIHERDFTPGNWIIDNIIENIESSRKVILVLSRNFVNSEWCNYELYFAHQRAIGRSFQDVVLLVMEAISSDSLPSKFCKLRKMLDTKTYLEWPPEPNRQPFFWVQLRNVLGKADPEANGWGDGPSGWRSSLGEAPSPRRPGGGSLAELPGGGSLAELPGGGSHAGLPGGGSLTELSGGGSLAEHPGGGSLVELSGGGSLAELSGGGSHTGLRGRGSMTELPGGGSLAELPSGGSPVELSGGGSLAEVPGGGSPVELSGGGSLAEVPGGGSLTELPGGGSPAELSGGGSLAEVPGGGSPVELSGGGSLAEVPGGGSLTELPGGGSPAELSGGGSPAELPGGGSPAELPGGGSHEGLPGGGSLAELPG